MILAAGGYAYAKYAEWNRPGVQKAGISWLRFLKEIRRWIAQELQKHDVISDINTFLIIADLRGLAIRTKAGEYEIKGASTPYEKMDMLATGYAYRRALTIPEGFTQTQIGEACEQLEICTREDFLQTCRDNDVFTFAVAQAPGGANAAVEGILYPETYYFIKDTPPIKVFDRMRNTFAAVWDELMAEPEIANATGLWWQSDEYDPAVQQHRVIIMASLIEKRQRRMKNVLWLPRHSQSAESGYAFTDRCHNSLCQR